MHEVEIINDEAQMAYVGETPWHGLGKRVPADLSPEQMLVAAGLDWSVEKRPIGFKNEKGNFIAIKGPQAKQALVRTSDNTVLDIVGRHWNPLQNVDAFETFNDFVLTGDMEMHTAGSLKNGQIVWALAKVNDSFETVKGDQVDSYFLLTNPHVFGRAIDVRFTPIRVVCNNTLSFALESRAKQMVQVSHRSRFDPEYVKEALGIAKVKLSNYKDLSKFLAKKNFTEDTFREYFNSVFPTSSKKTNDKDQPIDSLQTKRALEVIETQPGAEFATGSWWHAFNTVTYLTDHALGRNQDTRLSSAWYGANRDRKLKALEQAVKFAEAA